jgi:uncharacterized protein (TIGR02646 family)
MIKLSKAAKPNVLTNNEVAWTIEYAAAIARRPAGPPAALTRYKHQEVKAAVKAETDQKCAYCESHISQVYAGDVEHLQPKSARPDLVVTWENLTYACQQCNVNKADYYSVAEPLLNPYVDEPSDHLRFLGPACRSRPTSDLGIRTRLQLRLDREELISRRISRINELHAMLETICRLPLGETRTLLERDLRNEVEQGEYVAMSRAYVAAMGCP